MTDDVGVRVDDGIYGVVVMIEDGLSTGVSVTRHVNNCQRLMTTTTTIATAAATKVSSAGAQNGDDGWLRRARLAVDGDQISGATKPSRHAFFIFYFYFLYFIFFER